MDHADLMTRLENSSANESSHELACRCQDARKALAAADVRVAELEAANKRMGTAFGTAAQAAYDEIVEDCGKVPAQAAYHAVKDTWRGALAQDTDT